MKLRIKGNSIRIRLSKTEVEQLVAGSSLLDNTSFGNNVFGYSVKPIEQGDQLSASFDSPLINMYVPKTLLKDWSANSIIGFEAKMPIDESQYLSLLLEKDFKCIDETVEDQSDFFDNPAKSC